MAKTLQKDLVEIEGLEKKNALSFLPRFLEKILMNKSMIELIIKKEDYNENFIRKFVELIDKVSEPNGWRIEQKILWDKITKEDVINWLENNTKRDLPVDFHKNLEKFIYTYMKDTYKILSAIIKEAEETE